MDDIKKCSKCDNEKDLSEFCFRKNTQRYRIHCRDCIKIINTEYHTMKKDEIKIQRKESRENIKKNLKRIYDIDYRERNRERIQLYKKNFFQKIKQELYKKFKKEKMKIIIFD